MRQSNLTPLDGRLEGKAESGVEGRGELQRSRPEGGGEGGGKEEEEEEKEEEERKSRKEKERGPYKCERTNGRGRRVIRKWEGRG